MKIKTVIWLFLLGLLIIFMTWRFIRPMNIFIVTEAFESAILTDKKPAILKTLSSKECASCHQEFYEEWKTSIHSQAWTEPYFQVDWKFDGSQHICRNCHTPLDKQQPYIVIGYRDKEKLDPVLEDNPDFDPKLQHEGVTCVVCHLQEGKIVGVYGIDDAPHETKKLDDPNQICVRCHVVGGDRWDTFFSFPPCGTVAEIRATQPADKNQPGKSGELVLTETQSLGCVTCHMPAIERPLVPGGKKRMARQHLWRGGHDPDMVRGALTAQLTENKTDDLHNRSFTFSLTNTGAAHYLPTGTPDRYLTVELRLLDSNGTVLKEEIHKLIRTTIWRPFIIDLWDTRLKRYEPREIDFEYAVDDYSNATVLDIMVRYHLLDEERRKRIGYKNIDPINYEVYRRKVLL